MSGMLATVLLGIGATAVMDAILAIASRTTSLPFPNYAMVGRWIAHMRTGQFRHAAIARAQPMPGERPIGWIAHYLIGVAFAAALLAICGLEWLKQPALLPALLVGIGTVAIPFLLMQPAMGQGIAASRAPDPWVARLRSLVNHAVFGLGLYVAGLLIAAAKIPLG